MEIFDKLKSQINRLLGFESNSANLTELLAELESTEPQPQISDLESRVQELESKISNLNPAASDTSALEAKISAFEDKISSLEQSFNGKLDKLARDTASAITASSTTSLNSNKDHVADPDDDDDGEEKNTIIGSVQDIINFSSTRSIV